MARYVAKVRTAWSPEQAFAYMADLDNFAAWDPGVRKVVQTTGSGGGATAVFDVTVAGFPKDIVLTYETVEYDEPRQFLVVAKSSMLISEDRVTVEPDGAGALVTYDASLRLKGVLGGFDLALKPVFKRIADRAVAGLVTALEGARV